MCHVKRSTALSTPPRTCRSAYNLGKNPDNTEDAMPLFLDHTIVPAHDKEASARFFAEMFGLEYKGPWGHFAPVKVNDTLSMDFDNRENFQSSHYAFLSSDEERSEQR